MSAINDTPRFGRTQVRRLLVMALAATVLILVSASGARADFGIKLFDGQVTADQDGAPFTQAGGHPYEASVAFDLNTKGQDPVDPNSQIPDENVKDVIVDLPAGFVGNPTVAAQCTEDELETQTAAHGCPLASQVGFLITRPGTLIGPQTGIGIFNMVARDGVLADFGVNVQGKAIVHMIPVVRSTGDYGLLIESRGTAQTVSLTGITATFWGVPADPRHDALRTTQPCSDFGFGGGLYCGLGNNPTSVPKQAFLTNPFNCAAGPVTTTLRANSWQHPDKFVEDSFVSHLPPAYPAPKADWGAPQGVTSCGQVPFDPGFQVQADSRAPDSPVGLSVDLTFPTEGLNDPDAIAAAPLKDAKVMLPEGMTINPSGAGGLSACSDEQFAVGATTPVSCPGSSQVGTVTAKTPLLTDTLTGGVYVATQQSQDPESGSMFRIFLNLVNKARGLDIKLPGSLRVDKSTGRVQATFVNNPQLPVSQLAVDFKGGGRAPLASPRTCGEKTVEAELTSWAGQVAHRQSTVTIDCTPGLGGFAPSLQAGAVNPTGGAFSPFGLSVSKPDGNADVTGLSMVLPTGLLAKLKGNLGTQVGSVKAFAGPGSNPFMLPGQVYLEGPYGDAPFSLKVVVPAKAGPFDLGEVVVRQKIYVHPITAQVTVVSDPVPTIVKGVPVRLQRLDVSVDKPGFMINPTSCAAKAIGGTLGAIDGQSAPINVRFQVGDCGSLALKPSLALSLSGKGQTTDGKHPAVTATVTQPAGQANLKKVRVALPLSLALDPDNANGLCEFVDGSKVTPTCPRASIVGSATAVTPILDEPLSGPVYFVKNIRRDAKSGREIRTLPKLVIPLVGQNGVKLTLTGTSNVEDDQLVTTFDNIPDAPVSSFKLNIIGGKGGILTVSGADICKSTQIADQQVDGQNNKSADADVYIQTPSCPTKIISKTIGKTTVKLKIGGLGAGKVTVTGRGIRKTTRTISKSTVATITAKRTGKVKPGAFKVKFAKAKAVPTA